MMPSERMKRIDDLIDDLFFAAKIAGLVSLIVLIGIAVAAHMYGSPA